MNADNTFLINYHSDTELQVLLNGERLVWYFPDKSLYHVIRPINNADSRNGKCLTGRYYKILSWDDTLPADDPRYKIINAYLRLTQ